MLFLHKPQIHYGLSYGVLATQAHFSWNRAVAMSVLVFSWSVQLVTVAMLTSGASFASVLLHPRC
jgi:predicted branched-subunit amino acid permease